MKAKEVTIYDIALALQLSPATVSRALKDHTSIGKETTRSVKNMAVEMGYQPNVFATNLRNNKTNTIGVIVPLISRPFMASAISGIEQVANEKGYQVLIAQTNDKYEKEVANSRIMFSSRVEGLIVSLSMETTDYKHFAPFGKKNIPLIFFDRVSQELEISKIVIDDYTAAFEATQHLIQQGCQRIAHLAGSQNRENYRNRLQGYLDALYTHKLPVEEELVVFNHLSQELGWEAGKWLLGKLKPDGIFSANDTAAVGLIQVIKTLGLRVPEDVAVVGFNNDPVATIIDPPLTTIDYPAFEMGRLATQQFLQQKQQSIQANTVQLPTRLIIRKSSLHKGI